MIDIRAQNKCAERTHQESSAEGGERGHQRGIFVVTRKECCGDRGGVVAKDLEIVHLQKISARHADYRPDLLLPLSLRDHPLFESMRRIFLKMESKSSRGHT